MTKELKLREAGGRIAPQQTAGHVYEVRYMGWPKGAESFEASSAEYPVKAITSSFAEAFPAGTRMRLDHDGFCDDGGRLTKLAATTTDTPVHKEDHPLGAGMYGHIRVAEAWSGFVEEFAHAIGVSISAAGELELSETEYDDETERFKPLRNENGKVVLKRFLSADESPYNAIDFVEAPGADGRIVARAMESAKHVVENMNLRERVEFNKSATRVPAKEGAAVPPTTNKEKAHMLDEESLALVREAATVAATQVAEASRPAPESAPEVRMEDVAEAAITAGLSTGGRRAVYEAVRQGRTDHTAVIAEQVAREDEIRNEIREGLTKDLTPAPYVTGSKKVGESAAAPVGEIEEAYQAELAKMGV